MAPRRPPAINQLTRYLPPLPSDLDLAKYFLRRPAFSTSQRALSKRERINLLPSLEETLYPRPEYIEYANSLDRLLRYGYKHRQDLIAQRQRGLYVSQGSQNSPFVGSCLLFAGASGSGKSTVAILTRNLYPLVINHTALSKGKIDLIQIPVLYMRCPAVPSQKQFLRAFYAALDETLIAAGFQPFSSRRTSTRFDLVFDLRQACSTYAIGLIVVDEFQDLLHSHEASIRNHSGQGQADKSRSLINFLLWIRDTARIPIVYIGTCPMLDFLGFDSRSARRSARMGLVLIDRIRRFDDPLWRPMCKLYWDTQWVTRPIPLGNIHETLFDLSQGISDILHLLCLRGQELAIKSGRECVNAQILVEAFERHSPELHAVVSALKTGRKDARGVLRDVWHPWLDRRYGIQ